MTVVCFRAHQLENVVVKHNSYIEGKAESHLAKATTVSETGCVSPLAARAADHGPDRAPQLATCSWAHTAVGIPLDARGLLLSSYSPALKRL